MEIFSFFTEITELPLLESESRKVDKNSIVDTPMGNMFVSKHGELWILGRDLQLKNLEYDNQIETACSMVTNVTTNPVVMLYLPRTSDIYIGNGLRCLVKGEAGMSETAYCPTSLVTGDGAISAVNKCYGYYKDNSATLGALGRFVTGSIDFGERMLKSIHDVELGFWACTNMWARLRYRTDAMSTTWRYSEWILVIDGGFIAPLVEAHDIQLEVKFTPGTDMRFEYAKLQFERRDLRNWRGSRSRYV
jgi:hypothetical protein